MNIEHQRGLLQIGEIAKATGIGIKSIKYYEKIGILTPDYVNEQTGYRYYSTHQIYWLEIIQIAVDAGFPLADLKQFVNHKDEVDYLAMATLFKETIHQRIKGLQEGLAFLSHFETDVDLMEAMHKTQDIYSLEMNEKYFYLIPIAEPPDQVAWRSLYSQMLAFVERQQVKGLFYDCGLMYHFEGEHTDKYAYLQLAEYREGCFVAPGGHYLAVQGQESMIADAQTIFSRGEQQKTLAIEMNIYQNGHSLRDNVKELRVYTSRKKKLHV